LIGLRLSVFLKKDTGMMCLCSGHTSVSVG